MPDVQRRRSARRLSLLALVIVAAQVSATRAAAQDAEPQPITEIDSVKFPNTIAGEFTPSRGFDVIKTSKGSLNISVYGLFRFVNQNPAGQVFTDHLGRERLVDPRNDLNWHRSMVWFTGFFHDPKFRYNLTAWSLGATQQTLIFGNLQYLAAPWFNVGVGMAPNLTARSLQGSWPFWAGSDRIMSEEFFRGGFSSGVWITGQALPRFNYTLSVNNNLSQLGVTQSNDTRDMALSANVRWQPTTGEFGPRNGFGDFEHHERVATQFGGGLARSRESRYADLDEPPRASQIKLSDGVNPFEAEALAVGVTVERLVYHESTIDWGVKYRGFSYLGEYYFRTLDALDATGPLPMSKIHDHGFMSEASYMIVPKTLDLYAMGGYVHDDFARYPWEIGGGLNYYPAHERAWRINLHLVHVERSPSSSFFGYYQAGHTGTVVSLGTDILF